MIRGRRWTAYDTNLLPSIRYTITICICRLASTGNVTGSVHGTGGLVADQFASGTPGLNFRDKAFVDTVARRIVHAHVVENPGHGIWRSHQCSRPGIIILGGQDVHVGIARRLDAESSAIQSAILVAVVIVF